VWPAIMVSDQPQTKVLADTLEAILNDNEVDAIVVVWWVQTSQISADFCELMEKLSEIHRDKPLVCSLHGICAGEIKSRLEASGRIIDFYNPDRAIRALGHLARYSAFRGCF